MYYALLGGGENICLETLSCFDKFSDRIKLLIIVLFNSKFEVAIARYGKFFTSFLACSSSDILKSIEVSVDFSINFIMVGVDKKAINRNKKKRAINFIEAKINLKKHKLYEINAFF
ncbi:MAG: hypothetical protein ABI554_01800 [Flavobacterium sp.]